MSDGLVQTGVSSDAASFLNVICHHYSRISQAVHMLIFQTGVCTGSAEGCQL